MSAVTFDTFDCRGAGCREDASAKYGPRSYCGACRSRAIATGAYREAMSIDVAALVDKLGSIEMAASTMGVARSYAYALMTDPTGERERDRKSRYGGVCGDCGARVAYGSARCRPCQRRVTRAQGWTPQSIVERFQQFYLRYGRAPRMGDVSPAYAKIARKRGSVTTYYHDIQLPHPAAVRKEMGGWLQAVAEAGIPASRRPRSGRRTEATPLVAATEKAEQARRRLERAQREYDAAVAALDAAVAAVMGRVDERD